ncbi:hypothetical protein SUGI_0777880 [Cryptomeria japonica]|nr:hypothetical protein SUGI_0777880 [Cryptomeria japonica]
MGFIFMLCHYLKFCISRDKKPFSLHRLAKGLPSLALVLDDMKIVVLFIIVWPPLFTSISCGRLAINVRGLPNEARDPSHAVMVCNQRHPRKMCPSCRALILSAKEYII